MDFQKLADQSTFSFHKAPLNDGLMNPNVLNVGLDIGYGSLKVISKYGLHKVQSLVIPFTKPCTGNFSVQGIYMNEGDILYIEDIDTPDMRIWAVGRKALDTIDAAEITIDVDEYYNKKWFLNKEFQILFQIGVFLGQMRSDFTLDPEIKEQRICIGLPVQWIKLSNELQESLLGKRSFSILLWNGQVYHFSFELLKENIHVIPQHEGSLNSVMLDYEGNMPDPLDFAHKDILLVDAGNRTVDTHLLLRKNQGKSKTWLDVSMLSIKNDICDYILEATDYEREIFEYQLDRYIAGDSPCQIRFGKTYIDFSQQLQQSIHKRVRTLAKRLEMVYGLDDLDQILISGGSGLCYYDELKQAFEDYNLFLVQDSDGPVPYNATFSNVVGFYKLLIFLAKQMKPNPQELPKATENSQPKAASSEEQTPDVKEPVPAPVSKQTEAVQPVPSPEPEHVDNRVSSQEAPPASFTSQSSQTSGQTVQEPIPTAQVSEQPQQESEPSVMQKLFAIPEHKKSPMLVALEKRAALLPENSPQRQQVEHMIEVLLENSEE